MTTIALPVLCTGELKIAKSHIFESNSFFYSSKFSGYDDVCRAGNGHRVYQPKERLALNREIGKSCWLIRSSIFYRFFPNILIKISASV